MPWDEGLAQLIRDDLANLPVTEKRMFGGIAFLLTGNMLCGIHKGGAMFRVGKPNHNFALTIAGAAPMMFTGKPMSGMITLSDVATGDDAIRGQMMALALGFVTSLPPK